MIIYGKWDIWWDTFWLYPSRKEIPCYIYGSVREIKYRKYNNEQRWRQNIWHECLLSHCRLHSHNSVILPSFFFCGLPCGWGSVVNVCASCPMDQGLRHQWRSYRRSWTGCVATGGWQCLHRHPKTWTAQCKSVRIARGYAWTSGRMILLRW